MKILQPGRKGQRGWAIEATCKTSGGCGARLLVEERDITMWGAHDYGGGYDTYCTYVCGQCGMTNHISPDKIPGEVYDRKMRR